MNKTSKKIEKIISEIEHTNISLKEHTDEKKTVSQVIDILLNKDQDRNSLDYNNQNINKNDIKHGFDMHELSLWKDKNNQLYKVDYYRSIYSNRRFLSKPIIFFKRVVRKVMRFLLEPIVNDQNEFNASVTASINALYNNTIVTESFMSNNQIELAKISSLQNNVDNIQTKIQELDLINNKLEVLNKINEQLQEYKLLSKQIDDLSMINNKLQEIVKLQNDEINILKDKVDEQVKINYNLEGKINEIDVDNVVKTLEDSISNSIDLVERKIDNTELWFLRTLKEQFKEPKFKEPDGTKKSLIDDNKKVIQKVEEDTYSAIDYFSFENHFRGSRSAIKKSQEIYIDYFTNKGEIIDLGCGRGEFLELLQEKGIQVTGVDAYAEFVEYCKAKGLNAIQADAITYINSLENDSIGGIFASQLVEHLETNQLVQLCQDAYKKLKFGGYFILETPNPTSLSIFMNAFYIDPSHNKPVHPKTLEYFMQQSGFKDIEIIYTEQSKVGYQLPLLNGENISNLSEFNDGINCISNIIFGSQDYAIIAKK
ncbi:methyltransferase domain-containing protein [Lachnospiraceae bacterium MD1]|uniref:Methyltransferase domain-containing protein n=1 Tax=Variimorphobacter saccharofermentans TaxID=2755051 RepID=A0A839K0X5_9FIRM|nr:class I SAM-dependent methyltransferase [Variimorphobacter saccharofermentans]MBB2182842.1 methyltransferase domain-containing protein [Variimorphobacter saccharofermentans]